MTEICGIKISNPDKIVYPNNITKLDVIKYYEKVAPLMLPYINKRLLSVIRCNNGIQSDCFFKKHPQVDSKHIKTFYDGDDEYFYVDSKEGIIFQAQMGTIEFHPWGSSVPKIEKPDVMIFDLDPDEKLSIEKLRQGVLHLKSILDELNLVSFLKTSGGKGYHVVVPFSSTNGWESFANFSKQVALLMEQKWPKLYTTNIRKDQRKGKIFIDYLRNKKGSTCVAAYSLRSRDGATVSMPIEWSELDKFKPDEFNIKNAIKRIKKNPWKNYFEIKQKLK